MAGKELLATIRDRYQPSTRREKGRVLAECTAVTGLHRKHAVRAAVKVVWEAPDRICGKRAHAALPHLVESIKRVRGAPRSPATGLPGQATAAYRQPSTLDRLLKRIRATGGSRGRRGRRKPMGHRAPVRIHNDWNKPRPGCLVRVAM